MCEHLNQIKLKPEEFKWSDMSDLQNVAKMIEHYQITMLNSLCLDCGIIVPSKPSKRRIFNYCGGSIINSQCKNFIFIENKEQCESCEQVLNE